MNIFISLHLPKTAGSSFRAALEQTFGHHLLKDYQGSGISLPQYKRHQKALQQAQTIATNGLQNVECVHGHFLPFKYLLLDDTTPLTFITWMREPVSRAISHYYYWQRNYNSETSAPHHKKVIEERWSLEKFCLSLEFQNIYCQYLWAFPLEYFSFIGITEHYDKDVKYFSDNFLRKALPVLKVNTGTLAEEIPLSKKALKKIQLFHQKDITLYQKALELRQIRLKIHLPNNTMNPL